MKLGSWHDPVSYTHLDVYKRQTPDGTGVRDYIHVLDLASGHLAAVKYNLSHKGAEIFNLGTGHGYSVLDLVKTFEAENKVAIPYLSLIHI